MLKSNHTSFVSGEIKELATQDDDPALINKAAGEIIFKMGNKGKFMFVVQIGRIDIMVEDVCVEQVRKGGFVGEMALIDQAARSATAIAGSDCALIPISRWRFLHLVKAQPDFALQVMGVMEKRLREMNARLSNS